MSAQARAGAGQVRAGDTRAGGGDTRAGAGDTRARAGDTITYREAMRQAIREALLADERVFLMGEDVGAYGGCFGVSKGLLDEFGPERIRDTPLSESAFVGAGIGAAMGGMRPIVEVMTVNFCLLALDQIMNNAATISHMSGGQLQIPLVIRMTTGAGRQVAAQHSHSLEGWLAHIPGLKLLAPATLTDARYMLAPALADPNPVLIFEHGSLYNLEGELPGGSEVGASKAGGGDAGGDGDGDDGGDTGGGDGGSDAGGCDIERAAIARAGGDITVIAYGGTLPTAMSAAQELAGEGVQAEVIDLRVLRPLDDATVIESVTRTHRAVIVDEGWRSGSLAAEVSARITEHAFYELDAPVQRVCSAEVPMPYAQHLEQAALPQPQTVVAAVRRTLGGDG